MPPEGSPQQMYLVESFQMVEIYMLNTSHQRNLCQLLKCFETPFRDNKRDDSSYFEALLVTDSPSNSTHATFEGTSFRYGIFAQLDAKSHKQQSRLDSSRQYEDLHRLDSEELKVNQWDGREKSL